MWMVIILILFIVWVFGVEVGIELEKRRSWD